jgi:hypothetical protein
MIIKGGTAGLAYLLVSLVIVPFVGRVHARMVYRSAARALPRCSSSFKTALVHWQAGIVKSIANVVGLVSIPGASQRRETVDLPIRRCACHWVAAHAARAQLRTG